MTLLLEENIWRKMHSPEDAAFYRKKGWWLELTHFDAFIEQVKLNPEKKAIVSCSVGREKKYLTYQELSRQVDNCVQKLVALNVHAGDIVSIQLPNGIDFPAWALATMKIGAIPNPIPIIYREKELSFMLNHAGSKVFVVPVEFKGYRYLDVAKKLQKEIDTLASIVAIDPVEGEIILGEQYKSGADFSATVEQKLSSDSIAVMLFTSGTTGTPKAALHTYNTIRSAGRAVPDSIGLTSQDVCFMASTMGHLTGYYWGMLLPLSIGQTVVYQDVWNAKQLLSLIGSEKITWTLSATPFALDLLDAYEQDDYSIESFRAFVCGGASVPPQVAILMHEQMGVDLITLWGCTESGICTIHKLDTSTELLAKSDGYLVEGYSLRIVDDSFSPVEEGASGRLQVKGPGVFAGYYKQDELTAEIKTVDAWLETGDMGRQTEDSGIRITGRSKDIIIRGGQNIPVVEIEAALLSMEGVREVAVIGIVDDRLGERGCAVIVPDGVAAPDLSAIQKELGLIGMAKQFWPERLEIVDNIAKTPSGKIQKFLLRELFSKKVNS